MLVENALLYSPAGGEVEIECLAGAIEVRDRGAGLQAGEAEEVFERFHRGSAGRQGVPGSGLGLPIARELARRWGADVRLRARAGGGTIAELAVAPAAGGSNGSQNLGKAAAKPADGRGGVA